MEFGCTDAVRNTLPSSVRIVADKIYRGKTGTGSGTGTGGSTTTNGKSIKSVTRQVIDVFTKMDNLTPTVQQQVLDDLYSIGFASDTAPEWFTEDMYTDSSGGLNVGQNYGFPNMDSLTGKDRTYTKPANHNKDAQWQ